MGTVKHKLLIDWLHFPFLIALKIFLHGEHCAQSAKLLFKALFCPASYFSSLPDCSKSRCRIEDDEHAKEATVTRGFWGKKGAKNGGKKESWVHTRYTAAVTEVPNSEKKSGEK